MKKTKKTLMTAAVLTAAAMSSHNVKTVGVAMAPVYGPPPATTVTTMNTTISSVYGPPVAISTTADEEVTAVSSQEEYIETTNSPLAGVYGPPPAYTTVTDEAEVTTVPVISEEEYTQTTYDVVCVYGPPDVFYDDGDVNMDTQINIADYNLILSAAQGEDIGYSPERLADVDNNGVVDADDVEIMRKYLTGQIDSME